MAEEMPVGLRGEPPRLPLAAGNGDAEAPRPPGEGHPFVGAWTERDVVAARGQLNRFNVALVEREQTAE